MALAAGCDSTGTVFVVFGGDGFPTNIISLESDMMLVLTTSNCKAGRTAVLGHLRLLVQQ